MPIDDGRPDYLNHYPADAEVMEQVAASRSSWCLIITDPNEREDPWVIELGTSDEMPSFDELNQVLAEHRFKLHPVHYGWTAETVERRRRRRRAFVLSYEAERSELGYWGTWDHYRAAMDESDDDTEDLDDPDDSPAEDQHDVTAEPTLASESSVSAPASALISKPELPAATYAAPVANTVGSAPRSIAVSRQRSSPVGWIVGVVVLLIILVSCSSAASRWWQMGVDGNGYEVTCNDGTRSLSGGIQGACSHHGGVAG